MRAIILSVGDELVLGQTIDTNSAYLSDQLVRLGIATLYHQTLADDRAAIALAIAQAAAAGELVLVSGGLGPTEDDLTRDALADALGAPLVLDEASVEAIRQMFTRRGRPMPERNKVQALHPAGSEIIPNTCGTAPGIKARLGRATLFVVPGVPAEMVAMWECALRPEIARTRGGRGVILTEKINTFGLGESTVAERLGAELMDRGRNPKVGTTVSGGVVSVRVRSEFDDPDEARRRLDATLAQIERRLGPVIYGRGDGGLEESVVALLRRRNLTIATAESCTGGLVGKMITDVAGSSAVYAGGWVTYSDEMKTGQLDVPRELIDSQGAVSGPVVRAMAAGGLRRSGADLAVAVTGIAGPEGGTAEKPVGTVWVALAWRANTDAAPPSATPGPTAAALGASTDALRLDLAGDRGMIRERAAKSALQMVRFHLLGVDLEEIAWGRRVHG